MAKRLGMGKMGKKKRMAKREHMMPGMPMMPEKAMGMSEGESKKKKRRKGRRY